jgi:Zn-dependent protease
LPAVAFKVVDFAIQLAVILFAISFHESAHAYAALRFGDTTARDLGRISLNPIRHLDPFGSVLLPALMYILSAGRMIFGAAKPTPVDLRNTRNPRLANLVVSAAGPVSNFLLAAIAIGVLLVIKQASPRSIVDLALAIQGDRFASGALAPIIYVLFQFAIINVLLGVFNLIPIPPLDGSGVVISVFGGSVARVYATIAPFGFVILILLLWSGFLSRVLRPVISAVYGIVFGGIT